MAQFYGRLKGTGREVTKRGDKRTGLNMKGGGWTFGVESRFFMSNGLEQVELYLTSGSEGSKSRLIYSGSVNDVIRLLKDEPKQ